jgi:hypothetical protein
MTLSPHDKAVLLLTAIRGADDCFALRAFDPNRDQPHFWRPVYMQATEDLAIQHMAGELEIGSYSLIPGPTPLSWPSCRWIAADFDGKRPGADWQGDVQRFLEFIVESGANLLVNRSRSGCGAHVRVLFRDPVPAWMARRWMNAWLEEASILGGFDDSAPSFDRTCPMQNALVAGTTYDGHRPPGNLVGAPMHRGLALANGGTLPISVDKALSGNFEPDGKHWEYLSKAVEERAWGEEELLAALLDAPGGDDGKPPPPIGSYDYPNRSLTVLQGNSADRELYILRRHCAFFEHIQAGGAQPYGLWLALASQLHRFGEAGRVAWHELSALDPRYKERDTDRKWQQTADMNPMRCETLVDHGWRCPHLETKRCNGCPAPAYFAEHIDYEPI